LDDSSIVKTITNSGLHAQLAAATDPAEVQRLSDHLFYTNLGRALLVLMFTGLALLVYLAGVRRLKNASNNAVA
jgi:hypothetical protein